MFENVNGISSEFIPILGRLNNARYIKLKNTSDINNVLYTLYLIKKYTTEKLRKRGNKTNQGCIGLKGPLSTIIHWIIKIRLIIK